VRHVKAALLHLRHAQDLAELACVDIRASEHEVPEAGLIRAVGEAVQDLDLWTIGYVCAFGAAPAETYAHTEGWYHAEGGSPPAGSWPLPPAPCHAPAGVRGHAPDRRVPRPARRGGGRAVGAGDGRHERGNRPSAGSCRAMAGRRADPAG